MIINYNIKLSIKNGYERQEIPNLTLDKNLIPQIIKIYKIDQNPDGTTTSSYATDINFKFSHDNIDLCDFNISYFKLINNYVSLEEYKNIISRGSNCYIMIKSYSETIANYNIVIEYAESKGVIIYENILEKCDKLFTEININGFCTQLYISFSNSVKDLKICSIININEDIDENEWFYPFDIEQEEDNVYVIDFTKKNNIYSKYIKFLRLLYDDPLKNVDNTEQLKIYVIAYGYFK